MFDAIIRGTLGSLGSAILDFYIDNALWINVILLLYALSLVWAKRGYTKIKEAIKTELIKEYGEAISAKSERNFKKAIERFNFDWESIAQETWMPFVSTENALFFRIKSPNSLKKHFTAEKIRALFNTEKDSSGS